MKKAKVRRSPKREAPWTNMKDGDLQTPMPVVDFLFQLGLVMRLPAKPPVTASSPAQTAKPRVHGTRLWLPIVAVTSSIVFATSRLSHAPQVELPSSIVGTWRTTDPRYAGRELAMSGTTIFQADSNGVFGAPEHISGLSVKTHGDTTAVVIEHQTEGALASLQLVHVSSPDEYITLRNPGGVRWTRVRDGSEPVIARIRSGLTPPPVAPGKQAWEH